MNIVLLKKILNIEFSTVNCQLSIVNFPHLLFHLLRRFVKGSVVAANGGEGGELRRAAHHRHGRVVLRHMVRQIDDVIVIIVQVRWFHALCPLV